MLSLNRYARRPVSANNAARTTRIPDPSAGTGSAGCSRLPAASPSGRASGPPFSSSGTSSGTSAQAAGSNACATASRRPDGRTHPEKSASASHPHGTLRAPVRTWRRRHPPADLFADAPADDPAGRTAQRFNGPSARCHDDADTDACRDVYGRSDINSTGVSGTGTNDP